MVARQKRTSLAYLGEGEYKTMADKVEMTEEELQAKIQEEVNKAKAEQEAELKKKHDSEMAQLRIKAKQDTENAVKKAQEDATLTAEEKAKKEQEEENKAMKEELEQLRHEKKVNDRAAKLKEKNLPDFFKNDSRLLNAEEDKVDDVITTIEKEYKASLPDGAQINTNVKGTNTGKSQEQAELERVRNLGLKK